MKFILNITVEPVIFLLAFSNGFSDSGQVNLILEKVCRSDLCKNAICERPENCLQQSTGFNTLRNILKACLPVIPLLFAGYWRDKHGRNIPPLCLTISGQIFGALVCLLSSLFWKEFPILPTVLLEAFVTGLTGGFPLLLMSATCFITARTSVKDRTYRISLILAAYVGGLTIGLILGGLVLQNFGFVILYLVAAILAVISLVYTLFFINEVAVPSKKPLPIWLIFKAVVKKRKYNQRPVILMMIIVHCIFGTTIVCEGNIFFFFIEKSLKFSVAEAGIYSAYRSVIFALSSFIVIPVLSKYFQINDVSLGILSATFNCFSSLFSAFSRTKLGLSLCPLADLLKGGIFAVEKSLITKYVGPSEIGQVLSVEFVIEAFCFLMVLPLYTLVYNKTSVILPGAFFFFTGVFSLITLVIFCAVKYITKKNDKQAELDDRMDIFATHL